MSSLGLRIISSEYPSSHLGIWFESRIGSRGLGVWMGRICICDGDFVHFFCCRYLTVSQDRSSRMKGEERLDEWFDVEFGMRSITATR